MTAAATSTAGDAIQREPTSHVGARSMLSGGNKLKLGVFGLNCQNGLSLTLAPTKYEATWPHTLAIAQRADEMGFEILIPIARWRGLGGASNPFGRSFETMTWAAGIAALTRQITVVGTMHLPLNHPVTAAKQSATIDHISGGRFAFNAVMGWFAPDMEMFGQKIRDHDERYRYGSEWMRIVKRAWTEEEPFDFDGEYFHLRNVESLPKPLQKPYPMIINAGISTAGMDFAAREADLNFAVVENLEATAEYVQRAKRHAREKYQRDITLMGTACVICRDTEAEARRVAQEMLDKGDRAAAENSLAEFGINSESLSEEYRSVTDKWMVCMGAYPICGTPDQVAEGLASMSEAGLDGVAMGFLDYYEELGIFREKIMPRLVEMGLRERD
jgi:dimethylsulfone monooxygenase